MFVFSQVTVIDDSKESEDTKNSADNIHISDWEDLQRAIDDGEHISEDESSHEDDHGFREEGNHIFHLYFSSKTKLVDKHH